MLGHLFLFEAPSHTNDERTSVLFIQVVGLFLNEQPGTLLRCLRIWAHQAASFQSASYVCEAGILGTQVGSLINQGWLIPTTFSLTVTWCWKSAPTILISSVFSCLYYCAILHQPEDWLLRKALVTLWCPGSVSHFLSQASPHSYFYPVWLSCHLTTLHFSLLGLVQAKEVLGLTTKQSQGRNCGSLVHCFWIPSMETTPFPLTHSTFLF